MNAPLPLFGTTWRNGAHALHTMNAKAALEAHSTARDALVQQERALSFHYRARGWPHLRRDWQWPPTIQITLTCPPAALSTKESTAVHIIQKMREEELNPGVNSSGPSERWMGMPFTSSKEHMHESKLFAVIKQVRHLVSFSTDSGADPEVQMPKGAILHCHLDAM